MSAITTALSAFACIFAGALLGMFIRTFLPHHHLTEEVRDVVKLGAGLIATLAALVLGLLVSTAKTTLDTYNAELTQTGAKIIILDSVLASYGPETKQLRDQLRRGTMIALKLAWPENKGTYVHVDNTEIAAVMGNIELKVLELSPQNETKHYLKSRALRLVEEMAESRWLLIEQTQGTLPTVFLVVLLTWLTMLFACFGMLAPRNATFITVLFVCSLSVSGAVFLIQEMNDPLNGMIKISSAPLLKALEHIDR